MYGKDKNGIFVFIHAPPFNPKQKTKPSIKNKKIPLTDFRESLAKNLESARIEDKFSLKNYHDYMLDNGNIPIALQRWEYLGLNDQIKKLWPN